MPSAQPARPAKPRYQVFVSSTYLDLKAARQEVLHALLDLECIPAGMELFSASSGEQFEYIKQEIDQSDYYVLVLGWRYGSVHKDGVSYTEREFDYAVEKGIPVLVFPHGDETAVEPADREDEPERRARLIAFRERAVKDRMAKYWLSPGELSIHVNRALMREIRENPRGGWIRADSGPDAKTLAEIVQLRRDRDELNEEVAELKKAFPKVAIPDLAPLTTRFTFRLTFKLWERSQWREHEGQVTRSWRDIFSIIAPSITGPLRESTVSHELATAIYQGEKALELKIVQSDIETIRIQLVAQGLIRAESQGIGSLVYWHLTEVGTALMIELRTVRQQ